MTSDTFQTDHQFATLTQLEEGHGPQINNYNSNEDTDINLQEDSTWPMFSSILQLLTNDKKNRNNTSSNDIQFTDNIPNRDRELNTGFIPMSSNHIDPIQFLKNQEYVLLFDKIPKLTTLHEKYTQSGDNQLASTRAAITQILKELNNSYEALNEIYISEKYSKLSKYQLFIDWINKRSQINGTIEDITSESSEGQTYKLLLKKSRQIDADIDELEGKLSDLKIKKQLIHHQLLETKSLLDIKLNIHNDDLENLIQLENNEINLLFKEKQIRSNNFADNEVSDILKSQINSLDSLIDQTLESKLKFEQSFNYLSDIFQTLNKMENSINTFIQESKVDQLEPILVTNRSYLHSRLKEIDELNFKYVEIIINNEIKAIEKAMKILNISIPILEVNKKDKDQNNKSNDNKSSSINPSPDSTDYYHSSSLDNISLQLGTNNGNNKQNSLSTSPPNISTKSSTTVTTTTNITTNITGIGFKSNNNSKGNKYNLLLNEIKNSKGEKTD